MNVLGYTESGMIRVILDGDEGESFVPDDMGNRHRQMIAEWEAAGNTIPPYESPVPDLYAYLADLRWQTETGGIMVNGLSVATDDRSKLMLSGARIKADNDPTFTTKWKGSDGSFIVIDAPTIIAISDVVLDHVDRCFAAEDTVTGLIRIGQLTTTEAIDEAFGQLL